MASSPEELLGVRIGPYTPERLLGQGGFAWVFAARHADTVQEVALKVLKPRYSGDSQFEGRFLNEMKIAARMEHPNIVQIFDVQHSGEYTYFAMELYPTTLGAILERDGPLPEPVLHRLAMDITRGLIAAHAQEIIHRDIKVDNILLRSDGSAVLTDFGIARALSGYVTATGANMTIGTPHYLSPEQAQGRKLDGRADLYALGVTLYKASTGALPFKSTDWFELARMHVEEPPPPPTDLNPNLSGRMEKIILRCLAKHPDNRYSSAEKLLGELEAIRDSARSTDQFGKAPTGAMTALPNESGAARKKAIVMRVIALIVVAALLGMIAVL